MLFKYISKSRNQIKPLLLLVLSLLVIITLLGNSGIIKHFTPSAIATEPLQLGDLNKNFKLDMVDFVLYNIYLNDLRKGLPVDTTIQFMMDKNSDHKVDSLDLESFLGGMHISYYNTYWPYYFFPDSIPPMSEEVKDYARRMLSWIQKEHLDWSHWLRQLARQMGLTVEPPVKVNSDIDRNGSIELIDLALFFNYLKDSVETLPQDHEVINAIDYNADGRVNVMDTETFISYTINNYSIYYRYGLPSSFTWDSNVKYFAERQFAWLMNYHDPGNKPPPHYWGSLNKYREKLELSPSPPTHLPGDINLDRKRNLSDAAFFFNYLSDSTGILPDTNKILLQCDLNFDGTVDTLDTEFFLFFLFLSNDNPAEIGLKVPPISTKAQELAFRQFERFEHSNPEWKTKIETVRLELNNIPDTGIISCEINGDGRVNIADAIALIILGRNNDLSADWNCNGVFEIDDVISYLLDVRDGKCN